MISGDIRKWICFVSVAVRSSVNNSNIDTYSSAEDTPIGIRNYNSNSYRNSSNHSISNSMINIESDNNSNSNSNDSSDDTAMIPTIETTVSAVPTTIHIEILTVIILSLKIPVIFFYNKTYWCVWKHHLYNSIDRNSKWYVEFHWHSVRVINN